MAGATPDRARVPLTTDWTSHAELRPPFAISLASESQPNLASRARRARRRNAKKARCLEQRAFLSDQAIKRRSKWLVADDPATLRRSWPRQPKTA